MSLFSPHPLTQKVVRDKMLEGPQGNLGLEVGWGRHPCQPPTRLRQGERVTEADTVMYVKCLIPGETLSLKPPLALRMSVGPQGQGREQNRLFPESLP